MKSISIWLFIALLALLFTVAFAQDESEAPIDPTEPTEPTEPTDPSEPTEPTTVPFAKLYFTMKIPKDHDIIDWQKNLNKLSSACGVSNLSMVKNGPGEEKFVFYTSITAEDAAYESFKTTCEAAINANASDLASYGNIKFQTMEETSYPSTCVNSCGTSDCQPCPLLTVCTDDSQCGAEAKCEQSEENKDQKWCLSSSAIFITSTFAVILAVATILF